MAAIPAANANRIFTLKNPPGPSGKVLFDWQKSSDGLLAVSFEGSPVVRIHNRQGTQEHSISLPGNCTSLLWDADGDLLAITAEQTGCVLLWDAYTKKLIEIDSGVKDAASCLSWSKKGKTFAYGTNKGNLLIYDHRSLRRIPVVGKHTKKILCSEWSNDMVLALGTADNLIILNNQVGEMIKSVQIRGRPTDLKFGHLKSERTNPNSLMDNTMSVVVAEKTLYLLKYEDGLYTPLELGFQNRYGNIICHHWHGDGYILITFSAGFIVLVSSHPQEIGTELILAELRNAPLRHSSLSSTTGRIAVCFGDFQVQIHEANDPRNVVGIADSSEEEDRAKPPKTCHWSQDGQLLAVITAVGDIQVFLTSVPLLGAGSATHIAHMCSLTDIMISTFQENDQLVNEKNVTLEIEPNIIALGPTYLGAACNNRVWFYSLTYAVDLLEITEAVLVKEYNSTIHGLSINTDYAAVRTGDRIYLHLIESDGYAANDSKTFPEEGSSKWKITCHSLTKEVLFYAGESGIVKAFHLQSWAEVYSVPTPNGVTIKNIYPNISGTEVVIIDKNGDGYFLNVSIKKIIHLKKFPSKLDGVLWDCDFFSKHVFITYSLQSEHIDIYVVSRATLYGTDYRNIGQMKIFHSKDLLPLCLKDGIIISQNMIGRTVKTPSIFNIDEPQDADEVTKEELRLEKLLSLRKFEDAYNYCSVSDDLGFWYSLKMHALRVNDTEYAVKGALKEQDYALAYSLNEDISGEEDWKLAAGHSLMNLQEYNLAEKYYLESSDRSGALEMYLAMHDWEKALIHAKKFAPEQVPAICQEYGESLEFHGNYLDAMVYYEDSIRSIEQIPSQQDANEQDSVGESGESTTNESSVKKGKNKIHTQAQEGLARCYIRCGQISRGIEFAKASNSKDLKKQCAEILEKEKQYELAGPLYEECELWDLAASIYIRLKNWNKVSDLLPNIKSNKIILQYAKAKEVEGLLHESAKAYLSANDYDNAIRLFVACDKVDEAVQLVKMSGSRLGALHVARFFEKIGDSDTSLRFLIISRCYDDALSIAFNNGKAELYGDLIQQEKLVSEFKDGLLQVAVYFEDLKDHYKAGKYYQIVGENLKAHKLLLRSAQSGVQLNDDDLMHYLTLSTIALKDEKTTRSFIEFLLGEKDGIPKDPRYLLNFYIGTGSLVEAAKAVLIVSKEEMNNGNYKAAHSSLLTTCRELKAKKMKIPRDILEALCLIHTYYLSKIYFKLNDDERSSRLFLRLCENISRFPKHGAQILTSCAMMCKKSDLKASMMTTLFTLMKPEYRSQIAPKFKTGFENTVRKFGKADFDDLPDDISPCPFCEKSLSNYQLVCHECMAYIPFCIASGRHIILEDLTACPSCEFPAIRRELLLLLEKRPECPLCGEDFQIRKASLINDPRPYLYQ